VSEDPYFKKVIPFTWFGLDLGFRVSQDLFSSYDIDAGTRLLLRTVAEGDRERFGAFLDLGCGYGPIGLTLKGLNPGADIHMVDRDALAVEYARRNAELNGLSGVAAYGSLGYDGLRRTGFDLIISNIPAKAGDAAIAYFLRDAERHLAPGGLVAVVVVSRLEPLVERVFGETPEIAVSLRRAREGHTVYHYGFRGSPAGEDGRSALERGVYDRGEVRVSLGGIAFPMRMAYNLPEFDSPSHATALLADGLGGVALPDAPRALVFNPGQGHGAVFLWREAGPAALHLVGRDLLALEYARLNLLTNGCSAERIALAHRAGLAGEDGERFDLIAGVLPEHEGQAALRAGIDQAAARLAPGGALVVAGSSTAAARLVAHLRTRKGLRVAERKKRGGTSLLVLRAGG
jgi:16S rRNA G1207 methylase RsmC